MSLVKINDRAKLDKIVASVTLKLGKKIPQQDVLDGCLTLSQEHIDELANLLADSSTLSKKRAQEIIDLAEDFEFMTKGSIDKDLYGI